MSDMNAMVACPKCQHTQADMGNGGKCEKCGYSPMPTNECNYVDIKLVFEDWQKNGVSVYQTEEGASLSYGDFHGGTTFRGKIRLDKEELDELKKALEKGFTPIFRICF